MAWNTALATAARDAEQKLRAAQTKQLADTVTRDLGEVKAADPASGVGLAPAGVGEFGVAASRIAALHRQFGLPVPQQEHPGRSAGGSRPSR